MTALRPRSVRARLTLWYTMALAGVLFKKDRIELCFSATPRDEPVPGFACSPEVYVKYEIMRVPADVEPKFVCVGACI